MEPGTQSYLSLQEEDRSPGTVALGRGIQSVSSCIVAKRIDSKSSLPSVLQLSLVAPTDQPK